VLAIAFHPVGDATLVVDGKIIRCEAKRFAVVGNGAVEVALGAMRGGAKRIAPFRQRPDRPVKIEIQASDQELAIRITDEGGGPPDTESEAPDLLAKLAGEQSPRGWGLFLIKNMVDEMNVTRDEQYHTIELVLNLENN
jgi:sensor histidine kinase regulating citrate/malate metabolism